MSDYEKITKALYQRTGKYTGSYKELEDYKKIQLANNPNYDFENDPKFKYLKDKKVLKV